MLEKNGKGKDSVVVRHGVAVRHGQTAAALVAAAPRCLSGAFYKHLGV